MDMHHLTDWIPIITGALNLATAAVKLAATARLSCGKHARHPPGHDTPPPARRKTE
jgi:hypothetical protein